MSVTNQLNLNPEDQPIQTILRSRIVLLSGRACLSDNRRIRDIRIVPTLPFEKQTHTYPHGRTILVVIVVLVYYRKSSNKGPRDYFSKGPKKGGSSGGGDYSRGGGRLKFQP